MRFIYNRAEYSGGDRKMKLTGTQMSQVLRVFWMILLINAIVTGVMDAWANQENTGSAATSSLPAGDELIEALEPDVLPELQQFIEAVYPPDALRAGLEGSVMLELLVNTSGQVDSVFVVTSLEPGMDRAAAEAASQFVFSPAIANGEPVPVYLQFAYSFSIREQARQIEEYVNFKGRLKERGTRIEIAEAMVVATFPAVVNDTTVSVPWPVYLERLGTFQGQFLESDNLVTFTDSLGQFEFRSLPAGLFKLSFPNAGYEPYEKTIDLEYNEQLSSSFILERSNYDEFELFVYGKAEEKEVTRQKLTLTEIERLPGFGGDAIKAVQALPGVARVSFGSGAIIVRGSGEEDTRYFIDGIDIPLLFHFGGLKSTYHSQGLSSIDLYPGGFNTRYGDCVGGVIEIKGKLGERTRWKKSIDLNLLDSSFRVEGPVNDKLTLSMNGRRSYIGTVLDQVTKAVDIDMTVVPYYWDIVTRADYQLNKNENMFLTFFTVKDKMTIVADETEGSTEVSQANDAISMSLFFYRLIFGYDRNFGENIKNELRLALGYDKHSGNTFGEFAFKWDMTTYTVRDELSIKYDEHVAANLGVDMVIAPVDYDVNALGAGHSQQKQTFTANGVYANFELRPSDKLLLIPGVRYDYYKELSEGAMSYRVSSRFKLTDKHTLTAAAGTYNQTPVPRGQSIDPVFGNPDLPPTKANHLTIGDEWQITDMSRIKIEGYYNTQKNIPMQTDSLDLNFLPDMKARMYGLELMLRREQGKRFFGWLSYSISRSERKSPWAPNSSITEWDPDKWVLSGLDQTHHFEAVGSWNIGRNWAVGSRLRYVTGNPDTPLLGYSGSRYEFNADTGEYVELLGEFRSDRMGSFFQADFRIDKKYVFDSWILSVYLDVQNANYSFYNSPEFYLYSFDGSERKEYGGIILPTIGFRAEF